MSQPNSCPECGAPLPASAPRGLCPACLLKRGLETNTIANPTMIPPTQWLPPAVEEVAARFPELEILRLIGRGGMGAVYQARQKNLDRVVALKILPPEMAHAPAFAQRFAREAQAMARLNHPHIVTIYEFGERSGWYFFIMEFVDGLNLRAVLNSGHISPQEALAIVPQICEALQYAHEHGIVHRDIKPENILLNKQGDVKIADFGLVKLMGRDAAPEPIMGTPKYMAPEQRDRPTEVDHRADIYSLGVVFYEMLTGKTPDKLIEPPSRKVVIDVRLDEVVLRALEREPRRRYQQASEVKTVVETIAGDSPHDSTPDRFAAASAQTSQNLSPWCRLVELMVGIRFTSPVAIALTNLSALGFLGFLGNLRYLDSLWPPLAYCAHLSGLFGLFGLIGFAIAIEFPAARRRARAIRESGGPGSARDQLNGPSVGLLLVGIANWLFHVAAVIYFAHRNPAAAGTLIPIILSAFVCDSLIILAALKMRNLEHRGLCIGGSILALVTAPGNIIGLPIGIWSLVVLSHRDIKNAFAQSVQTTPRAGPAHSHRAGVGRGLLFTARINATFWLLGFGVLFFGGGPPNLLHEPPRVEWEYAGTTLIFAGLAIGLFPARVSADTSRAARSASIAASLVLSGWVIFLVAEGRIHALWCIDWAALIAVFYLIAGWLLTPSNRRRAVAALVAASTLGIALTYALTYILVFGVFASRHTTPQDVIAEKTHAGLAWTEMDRETSSDAVMQKIQAGIVHQLADSGASIDTLILNSIGDSQSGTSFEVTYSGLIHFKSPNGTTLDHASGKFDMSYIGGGTWQGSLAGMTITVQVATVDNIDLPFINDPDAIGQWQSVDFVADPSMFNPDHPTSTGSLYFKGLTLLADGKTSEPWFTWTRGTLIHHGDKTASHYQMQDIQGQK